MSFDSYVVVGITVTVQTLDGFCDVNITSLDGLYHVAHNDDHDDDDNYDFR